jgi:hypothetical protein
MNKKDKSKEYLKCDFSSKEIEIFADDLSRKIGELELKRLSKKDVIKSIDSEIAKTEVEISSLATRVKDKYEYRMVDAEIIFDYEAKVKRFTRIDTGEVYKTIPLGDDELQIGIPIE